MIDNTLKLNTMKIINKTFLPENVVVNGTTYVYDRELNGVNVPDVKDGIIGVSVLSKNLKGKLDLHGKPYQPHVYFFRQDFSNIVPKVSDKFEIGAILNSDWGYDQSNIDFYMIVALTDSFATVVPMKKEIKGYAENGTINVIPTKIDENAINKYGVIRKKIRHNSGQPTVDIHEFESASLWSGLEMNSDSSFR